MVVKVGKRILPNACRYVLSRSQREIHSSPGKHEGNGMISITLLFQHYVNNVSDFPYSGNSTCHNAFIDFSFLPRQGRLKPDGQ
jgi:hypothetical protein